MAREVIFQQRLSFWQAVTAIGLIKEMPVVLWSGYLYSLFAANVTFTMTFGNTVNGNKAVVTIADRVVTIEEDIP